MLETSTSTVKPVSAAVAPSLHRCVRWAPCVVKVECAASLTGDQFWCDPLLSDQSVPIGTLVLIGAAGPPPISCPSTAVDATKCKRHVQSLQKHLTVDFIYTSRLCCRPRSHASHYSGAEPPMPTGLAMWSATNPGDYGASLRDSAVFRRPPTSGSSALDR